MYKWSHTAEMQLFSLGGFALPLTLEGCQNFLPIFMKAFLRAPSSKASLEALSTQGHDLRDPEYNLSEVYWSL